MEKYSILTMNTNTLKAILNSGSSKLSNSISALNVFKLMTQQMNNLVTRFNDVVST